MRVVLPGRFIFAMLVGTLMLWASEVKADYPPLVHYSELQPPTEWDWYRLYLLRQMRCQPCDRCGPIVVYRQIFYFDCTVPCGHCGAGPVHRSYRGNYGIIHPAPYYIKEPTLDDLYRASGLEDCRRSPGR